MAVERRSVETRTIRMSVAEQGTGPLVLLCHGFPETSHAWRHQIGALAAAGFRAVAPDLRGYGGTERPEEVDAYTVHHVVGDMVALLDALGERSAVVVGNDWGATVAWQAAQMRPDRFRSVVAIGVPMMERAPARPTTLFPQTPDALFYTLYFQQPGAADAELDRDPRSTLLKILFAASGDAGSREPGDDTPNPFGFVSREHGLLAPLPTPDRLPAWLSASDLNAYAESFASSGFTGPLNYYRNLDRNWELQAALAGVQVSVPALFMAGSRDPGLQMPGMAEIVDAMPKLVPGLHEPISFDGAGHWLPQERPAEVSEAIVRFAMSLPV